MMTKMMPRIALGLLALGCAGAQAATPDLNGVWQPMTPVTQLLTSDGAPPPLTDAGQKTYDSRQTAYKAGKRDYDATLKCKPMGEPRTSYDPDGGPFEILQNPKEIVFAHTWNRMIRFVYLNGKAPDVIGPSYYGTATGAWKGGKLVIDARGFQDTTLLDQSGLPHSTDLRLTETYQLAAGGKQLVETIRFEDPQIFTKPWETKVTYNKMAPGTRIAEDVCIERLHITNY